MGLVKRTYTDRETVITAENMNDIQDAILDLEDGLFSVDNDKSGEVITITDAAKRGFRSLNIFGKTTQDGTPTPDAPVDLVSAGDNGSIGVTVTAGKNLLAKPFLIGVHSTSGYTNANDKVISTEGFYLKAGTYVISGTMSDAWTMYTNGMANAITANGYQQFYSGRVFTIPEDGVYNIQFNKVDGNSFTDAEIRALNSSAQVEVGSNPTAYEPYKGQLLTISTLNGLPGIPVPSGGNYTDANGQQWVCDEIDLARGVYVQRLVRLSLAVADMNNSESYPGWTNSGIAQYYPDVNNIIGIYGVVSMCNIASDSRGKVNINTISGRDILMIPNPNGMTQTQWKTQYPDLVFKLIFSVPNPIETPLTEEELATYATLYTYKDHTTVSNDAGAYMELEYVMDAKKYIDSLIGSAGGGASAEIHNATVE